METSGAAEKGHGLGINRRLETLEAKGNSFLLFVIARLTTLLDY